MDYNDPLETVVQLRAWVEKSLPSLRDNAVRMAAAKKRYRKVLGIIDQLGRLQIPISEDLISEKESLEEMIKASSEKEKLAALAKELSSLAKEINRQLRSGRDSRKSSSGRRSAKHLRVSFSDGTVISESKATDTYVNAIQYIGFERVANLRTIRVNRHPIVSVIRNELSRGYRELDGYFVETHLSTKDKAKYLQRIVDALQIDVTVDVID